MNTQSFVTPGLQQLSVLVHLQVITAWMFVLVGAGMTVRGMMLHGDVVHASFLALALLPLLLATWHVANARHEAKAKMVRHAFELERHARQCGKPGEHQRMLIVTHHCILSYLEEVLETSVSGSSHCHIPMHALKEYKQRIWNAPKVAGQGIVAPSGVDIESLRLRPKDDMLNSAAGGLRGVTVRGSVHLNSTQPAMSRLCDAVLLLCMPTMRVPGRLHCVREWCEYMVEVVLYKYGWQADDQLRTCSIEAAELKLLECSRAGRFWWYHCGTVTAFNLLIIGVLSFQPPPHVSVTA
jgi:hypothetical protein